MIETERLLLRELTLEDIDSMLQLYSCPDVQKYTGEAIVTSRDVIEKAVKERIANYKIYGYGRWATFLKEGMHFVGWSGLAYLPEFDEIDIGYRFLKEYWGQGIATEASNAILKYAFQELDIERIVAIALKENNASIKVMEKLGMHFEKYAPYEEGSIDAAWYTITHDDWKRQNAP